MTPLTESSARFWRGRRAYVTGATGLLGSWLTAELLDRGAEVVLLVRDDVRRSRLWDVLAAAPDRDVTVIRGSVEDLALQERVLNEHEIESVFHLAAQTIVGTAQRSPLSTFEANIAGTYRLLEAARRTPAVRRIVVASSDKAYGAQPVLPYTEATPLAGQHPYDVSKSCADLIAQSFFVSYGLPVCVTRCGNLFGGGDLNFNRLIPGTIRSLLAGERPIVRSDGRYLRDYFYVEEAARAYVRLAEAMEDPALHGEAFNFSTDRAYAVLEIVGMLREVMGSDLEPVIENRASGEIPEQHLDSGKARERLGWSAEIAVEDALERTVDWYRNWSSANRRS